jgi:hypothetical protein
MLFFGDTFVCMVRYVGPEFSGQTNVSATGVCHVLYLGPFESYQTWAHHAHLVCPD